VAPKTVIIGATTAHLTSSRRLGNRVQSLFGLRAGPVGDREIAKRDNAYETLVTVHYSQTPHLDRGHSLGTRGRRSSSSKQYFTCPDMTSFTFAPGPLPSATPPITFMMKPRSIRRDLALTTKRDNGRCQQGQLPPHVAASMAPARRNSSSGSGA
jgi:hypothetical protein